MGPMFTFAAIAFVVGYVFGSIPFGLIFARMAGVPDIRKTGSGNIGATNVLRSGKRWAAAATLLFDGGKGAVAVIVGYNLAGEVGAIYSGLGAFLGHVYPVWLRFKGGKGLATAAGIVLALAWPVGTAAGATWLAAAVVFRISSLAALITALATPFYFYWFGVPLYTALATGLAVLIFYTHRANIQRLLKGTEPKIGK
jgi:glycerol-3-phosphate acyltransferase PlsY